MDKSAALPTNQTLRSNSALHRIAALLRFCLKPKVHGWAARGELGR